MPDAELIRAIHVKVPGRARYRVEGLLGSESIKRRLESHLSSFRFVSRVSASTTTGNLLVQYRSGNGHPPVDGLIRALLKEEGIPGRMPPAPAEHDRALARLKDISLARFPAAVKDGISRALSMSQEQREEPWHLLEAGTVLGMAGTPKGTGLSALMIRERTRRYGLNRLPVSAPRSEWSMLLGQFQSAPVLLLGLAAGLSIATGGLLDAAVIIGVMAMNGIIGFTTERSAEKTIDALKHMIHPRAEVVREGEVQTIPAERVVIGDLLILKPGTYVGADCRVLQASHLSVDESLLTGESMPVFKTPHVLAGRSIPVSDRSNMVHMGTLVTGGQGLGVVVATGRYTEAGRLQTLMGETGSPETPIERQLRRVGKQLALVCGFVCGAVFLLGLFRGHGLLRMMRLAASLAGAAVPEGLPAAATVNFSLGIRNMRKHHVLIRRLQAIETLGTVQTICFDKTGTLTLNRMSVTRIFSAGRRIEVDRGRFAFGRKTLDPHEPDLGKLILCGLLCNESRLKKTNGGSLHAVGSPTENALIRLAMDAGLNVARLRRDYPKLAVNHRSEGRLLMSTLHESRNEKCNLLAVKGSPEEVLVLCSSRLKQGKTVPLTEEEKASIAKENAAMAGDALRVLGFALSELDPGDPSIPEGNLTWIGLMGMADPLRPAAKGLVEAHHRAGIRTVMVTGDQSPTATTVAGQLNLSGREPMRVLDFSTLADLDPEALSRLSRKAHVFSRVSPSYKLQIVQALQKAGQVVAMTGDGINDGPALKAADIGIAMGRAGTDVAREVSDIVLSEDNLEDLIHAIRDGRTTHDNIRKAVHFFISTNFTEIMVMFSALAAGIGSPLNVMQLLWINVISDIFPGIALSLEAPEPDVMRRPPRDSRDPLLTRRDFRHMALESAVISAGAIGSYVYGLKRYGMGQRAGSLAFHSLTAGQILHAVHTRSEKRSVFHAASGPPPNKYLILAVGGSLVLQALLGQVPVLRTILGLSPMSALDGAVAGSAALLSLFANEITRRKDGT